MEFSFDTRATLLTQDTTSYEPEIAAQWHNNQRLIREQLIHLFGADSFERKLEDFIALGPAPWSVIARHNLFLNHIRMSFAVGAYYASLVAAGALGERILNQLVITLRNDYQSHPATARVAKKDSFQNWHTMLTALSGWGVVGADVRKKFEDLCDLRNKASHYDSRLTLDGTDARPEALEAVRLAQSIISSIFAPHGGPPVYIDGIVGQSFIAREREDDPLIKHFFIPASVLVSPQHEWHHVGDGAGVMLDDADLPFRHPELSDVEFANHVAGKHD
ncbi:hypothetical protein H7I76_05310 [Mycolicibacterium vaccae]|nr:hypothetical protein [Mycolicibacterium vaccae]